MNRGFVACVVLGSTVGCVKGDDVVGSTDTGIIADTGRDARADVRSDVDAKLDTRADGGTDGTVDGATDTEVEDTTIGPPAPALDASIEDFGTIPPPARRVETLVGPAGGFVEGESGSLLEGVRLIVPAGALAAKTTVSIEHFGGPGAPPGHTIVSPYVVVGPDGIVFAVPAQLRLPFRGLTTEKKQILMGAYVGSTWSGLLSPVQSGASPYLNADMTRASSAAVLEVTPSNVFPPIVTSFSPKTARVGAVIFVEGNLFGLGPAIMEASATGVVLSSRVQIGGEFGEPIGWSEKALAIRVPVGSTGGAIRVVTPAGSIISSEKLTITP